MIFLTFNLKADQNSPKLDLYFEELLKVENISKQNVIVGAIWKEWLITDNLEIEKIMNIMPYFFQTQNYQEAVSALDYVIELDPMFAEGYNKRATVYFMTGEYEKVLPMDIYPSHLIKAIMVEDIELMENLGIYEVSPEDLALCEFVCTSKIPVQKLIRQGLDLIRKENS